VSLLKQINKHAQQEEYMKMIYQFQQWRLVAKISGGATPEKF
jgi:hypothetical protein